MRYGIPFSIHLTKNEGAVNTRNLFFSSPVTLKNLTEQMNASLNKGILLIFLFTSCKFEFGRYTRPRLRLSEGACFLDSWEKGVFKKYIFISFLYYILTPIFSGDLQSAREILAQMKYFANLEEKVKEKLRENF